MEEAGHEGVPKWHVRPWCVRLPGEGAGDVTENSAVSLVRLTYTLGIRDDARVEFWRFLRQVLREHRQQFGPAVNLPEGG